MKVSSISVWCMTMAVIVVAVSAWTTWTINSDSENYSSFLDTLREELGRGTAKVCKIPVTQKANNQKFVLVNIVNPSNGNTITLALRASDGYLVGFQDRDSKTNKLRANFFSDEYNVLKGKYKKIFAEAEILGPVLPCEGSYSSLESKGEKRDKIDLGVGNLNKAINLVYGVDFKAKGKDTGRDLTKFALISIQMISEAARFKHIEKQVKEHGMSGTFKAGPRIKLLENKWSKISKKYHASPRCQPEDDVFTEEEMELGLLLHKESSLNSNDGHVALAFI